MNRKPFPSFTGRIILPSFLLFVCLSAFTSLNADQLPAFVPADNPGFATFGRWDRKDPSLLLCTWPACYLRFSVSNTTQLAFDMQNDRNIFKILLDGQFSHEFGPDETEKAILTGLSPERHTITLIKRTESAWSPPAVFKGVRMETGGVILPRQTENRKLVEFIGDSFTAGYGVLSKSRDCEGEMVHELTDAVQAWAVLTADRLNADYMVNAWSGKGLVANYGDGPDSLKEPFPEVYLRSLQNDPSSVWNFSGPAPDAVVIFLGLNDFSTAEDPTAKEYIRTYTRFIRFLSKKYPSAKFLCLGYTGNQMDPLVRQMAEKMAKKKRPVVRYLNLPSVSNRGCHWHPDLEGQKMMADTVTPVLGALLGE